MVVLGVLDGSSEAHPALDIATGSRLAGNADEGLAHQSWESMGIVQRAKGQPLILAALSQLVCVGMADAIQQVRQA